MHHSFDVLRSEHFRCTAQHSGRPQSICRLLTNHCKRTLGYPEEQSLGEGIDAVHADISTRAVAKPQSSSTSNLDRLSGRNASAHSGGRQGQRPLPVRIVVDVREFMSHLPAVLHQQGFEVVPVTLEVCV